VPELTLSSTAAVAAFIASIAIALAISELSQVASKVRMRVLKTLFTLGTTFELLSYFERRGLPNTHTLLAHLVTGSLAIVWLMVIAGAAIVVQYPSQSTPLSADTLRLIFYSSAISQVVVDQIVIGLQPLLLLPVTPIALAVLNRKIPKLNNIWSTILPKIRTRRTLSGRYLAGAALAFVAILAVPSYLLNSQVTVTYHNASSLNSQILPLQPQGRQGSSSDSAFRSGILPNGPDGENRLPMVLRFYGSASASNPNIKQVVRVWVKGSLDHGRIGAVTIAASGVPQPSGYLDLVNSRALVSLRFDHLLGRGKVTLVNARALRGVLAFPRIGRFDFILTTIPSSYSHVQGSLTLISSQHGDSDTDADGANIA
jgi:hypothetical protein